MATSLPQKLTLVVIQQVARTQADQLLGALVVRFLKLLQDMAVFLVYSLHFVWFCFGKERSLD